MEYHQQRFPIYSVTFGSKDPLAPTLALIGGVHGQEKIGSHVVLSYLESLSELLQWDEMIHKFLEKSRITFLPIANPVGMSMIQRANGNGIDLNRNSPTEAEDGSTFLVGGQRISPHLPWYRGIKGAPLEVETQALAAFIKREVFPSRTSIAVDFHSGYGTMDRFWFLYAKSLKPFPQVAEVFALKNMLDHTYPNHVYKVEPSASSYTISGDLWDYLYDEHKKSPHATNMFMPFTLEMGSWLWLKKNPLQIFSSMGLFHPMHLHRHKRILRRHITLIEFLHRAVISSDRWAHLSRKDKEENHKQALNLWFSNS